MTQSVDHFVVDGRVPPPGKITYEEFLDWLDDKTHAEWVDGEVVMMAPISLGHDDISGFLFTAIREYVALKGLGRVTADPFQMKLAAAKSGRAPDVMFVGTEKTQNLQDTFLDGPCDLAIEVVSPGSVRTDRKEKYREYQLAGVKEYWIIDPRKRQFDAFVLGANRKYQPLNVDAEGKVHSTVVADFWIKVDWLWQTPRPTLTSVLREWGLI